MRLDHRQNSSSLQVEYFMLVQKHFSEDQLFLSLGVILS